MWGLLIAAVTKSEGDKAEGRVKEAARRNAAGVFAKNTETIRKTLLSQQQGLGQTKVSFAASGISLESASVQSYLTEMKDNFQKDIDWLKKARSMGVEAELRRGADAAATIRSNTRANTLNAAASAYNSSQSSSTG